jgi:hypothetical protein
MTGTDGRKAGGFGVRPCSGLVFIPARFSRESGIFRTGGAAHEVSPPLAPAVSVAGCRPLKREIG